MAQQQHANPDITPAVRRARAATYAMFFMQGVVSLSWLPHTPNIVERANLTNSQVGLAFSAVGLGSILVVAAMGPLVSRVGVRFVVVPAVVVLSLAIAGIGMARDVTTFLGAVFLAGCASAAIEVAAATSGCNLEQTYGRPIMPSFIGAMTLGMITGGVAGAVTLGLGISTGPYLLTVGLLLGLIGAAALPQLPNVKPERSAAAKRTFSSYLPRPSVRLFTIAAVVAVAASVEVVVAAFSTLYMIQENGAPEGLAAFAVVALLAGLGLMQVIGDRLRRRFSAGAMVRIGILIGTAVMAATIVVNEAWLSLPAFAVLGAGLALVYPSGISAAAETQETPALGIATAQTARFTASFAAPPLVGLLSERVGLADSFLVLLGVVAVVAIALASSLGVERGLNHAERDRAVGQPEMA